MAKIIKLENVSKVYETGKIKLKAVDKVNLEIDEGEFTALAGPSGSGKTTLLNLMGCIDTPSEGKIFYRDIEIESLNDKELTNLRRDNIGFIFQTFNLIPVLTAFENVAFPLDILKHPSAEVKEKVENLLEKVGLKDYIHHKPNEMSGGQQQRVAIARALIKEPDIILADEPTANLDSHNAQEILELMQKLNSETKTVFVFSTHDNLVMDFSKRLIHLHDGKIQDITNKTSQNTNYEDK